MNNVQYLSMMLDTKDMGIISPSQANSTTNPKDLFSFKIEYTNTSDFGPTNALRLFQKIGDKWVVLGDNMIKM